MHARFALFFFGLAALLLLPAGRLAANENVELELLTSNGAGPTDAHDWMAAMSELDFASVRVRQARAGEQPGATETRNGHYRVVGMITRDNRLQLPHGTFRMTDRTGIANWMNTLVEGGEQAFTEEQVAFGLRASELLALHEQLAAPVSASTSDRSTDDVVRAIAANLPVQVAYSAAARAALAGEETVADELQGITSGTALAAALRPLGLVLVPEKSGGDVQLRVAEASEAEEVWPVGWPAEGSPRDTLPKLFDFLDVEIEDQPLPDVLAAVQGRLDAPMLWDYNSLARRQIDPAEARVTIPAGNTFYKRILDRALGQNRLKYELRVDEAGQPILWLTTMN